MKIAGIDPSTKTGVVVLDLLKDDWLKPICAREITSVRPGFTRSYRIADSVSELLQDEGVEFVCIEDYVKGKFGSSLVVLEIGALIRGRLVDHNIPWKAIPARTLKKFTTGSGNAQKEDLVAEINKVWPHSVKSDNIADAYGLAKVAASLCGHQGISPDQVKTIEKYR